MVLICKTQPFVNDTIIHFKMHYMHVYILSKQSSCFYSELTLSSYTLLGAYTALFFISKITMYFIVILF